MPQNSNNIEIVPYVKLNNQWTLPDETIFGVFQKLQEDGTLTHVFYDGLTTSKELLLKLFQSQENLVSFILVDGFVRGVAWLNDIHINHASVHFFGYKEVWGRTTVEMGKNILSYWFGFTNEDNSPRFDVLLGVTPEPYKGVLRFIKQIGCTLVLPAVPDVLYNGYERKRMSAIFSFIQRPQK